MLALPQGTVPPTPRKSAPLSKRDWDLLVTILSVQSESRRTSDMVHYIRRMARSYGADVELHDGNLYVTKGQADLYPCYIAHTDTVHDIVPADEYKIFYDPNFHDCLFGANPKNMEPRGCGGDDKCGILVALVMLRDLAVCKAAFFRDEEIGCLGAREARIDFFQDCMFGIEVDRRGADDVIRNSSGTPLYNDAFAAVFDPIMREWGYKNAYGSITDVKTLVENKVGMCCMNVAAGYYDFHRNTEYVIPADIGRSLAFVKDVTDKMGYQKWEHVYEKPVYVGYTPGNQAWKKKAQTEQSSFAWREYEEDAYGEDAVYQFLLRRATTGTEDIKEHDRLCPECGDDIVDDYGWCRTCMWRTKGPLDDKQELRDEVLSASAINAECDECHQRSLVYDDTMGYFYCWECEQYIHPGTLDRYAAFDGRGHHLEPPKIVRGEWEH